MAPGYQPSESFFVQLVRFFQRYVLRFAVRWFLRLVTGKTELERILLRETKYRAGITANVERMIEDYEYPELYEGWTEDDEPDLADLVLRKNGSVVKGKEFEEMRLTLQRSLSQMRGYVELCELVEERRKEKYDSSNPEHEKRLLKLWKLLVPDEELSHRKSRQWQKIGFQGDDPASDFRGMGVLSLDQLLFLAQFDVANARSILSLSSHPSVGFPMAIASIAMTAMARTLLNDGFLKNHFYNVTPGAPTLDSFHHVYCQIFKLFCAVWKRESPPSVMHFNEVKDLFERKLVAYLSEESANMDTLTTDVLYL